MNAATAAPKKILTGAGIPLFTAIRVDAYAPIPKNAAWPSEPWPEYASRFHAEEKMMKISNGLLDGDVGLVAKAAAKIGDMHTHISLGHGIREGQVIADDERADGGRPDLDGAVLLKPDDGSMRLQRGARWPGVRRKCGGNIGRQS